MMGPRTRVEPLAPSAEALPRLQRLVDVFGPLGRALARPLLEITISGDERFPREGPVLVLTNHVSALDAGILMAKLGRPIQFMVTQAGLQSGPGARVFAAFGAVPKKKFTKDAKSVKTLRRWRDVGAAVGLFPEGQRSWDGHTLPLIPGIEKLVRFIDAPLVTGRILNTDRVWPRWAARPRAGRVHIALDAPVSFPKGTAAEIVRRYVEEHTRVDPTTCERWPVRGHLLAEGLANLLSHCPSCNAMDRLEERRSRLTCGACGSTWTVGTDNALRGGPGGGRGELPSELPIDVAWRQIKARFAEQRVADPARFRQDGVILESQPMRLLDVTEAEPREIASGNLVFRPDGLRLGDWRLPIEDLGAASVEFRRRLQFQATDGRLFEAVMPTESVVKWEWIVPLWQAAG